MSVNGCNALQLARWEVVGDGVERLLERLLVRDLARHQEAERVLDAGIVGDIDQTLVDNFCPAFGGDIGAQIACRLASAVDVGRRARCMVTGHLCIPK
jgi:hypothetical protein